MTAHKGAGRVSYRGILALGIGLMFVLFALRPAYFETAPPLVILVIMGASGAALAYGGVQSMRHAWKRGTLVRSQAPVPADVCVLKDDDTDRGTETVHVRVNGRCQALGVDRSGIVRTYTDGVVRPGEVWLDEKGAVLAVAIAGAHFNTLIGGRDIPADLFGVARAPVPAPSSP